MGCCTKVGGINPWGVENYLLLRIFYFPPQLSDYLYKSVKVVSKYQKGQNVELKTGHSDVNTPWSKKTRHPTIVHNFAKY